MEGHITWSTTLSVELTLSGQPLLRLFITPWSRRRNTIATQQESACKDIECAFGVLQTRFVVIRGLAYGWDRRHINDIMMTCSIFHNMIVDDEQDNAHNTDFLDIKELAVPYRNNPNREAFVATHHRLNDQNRHFQLQYDLMEHRWMRLRSLQH